MIERKVLPFVLWTIWCVLMALWPQPFAHPLLRAVVRIAVLLFPSIGHAQVAPEKDFFRLRGNLRRGVLTGLAVAVIYLLPVCLYRLNTGQASFHFPTGGAVWLNWIIGAPFTEELYFRAVLLKELLKHTDVTRAVLMSSLLFALFHLPWWLLSGEKQGWPLLSALGAMFGYGLVFALLFHLTKSFWASFIPHAANNFIAEALVDAAAKS